MLSGSLLPYIFSSMFIEFVYEWVGILQSVMDSDDDEERSSGCGGGRNMAMPMCARGTSPPSSVYRKVVQESYYDTSDSMKALTKAAYSYG